MVNVDATVLAEAPKISPHIAGDAGENRGRARGESERDQHQGDDERRTRSHRAQRRDGGDRGGECGGTVIVIPSGAKPVEESRCVHQYHVRDEIPRLRSG